MNMFQRIGLVAKREFGFHVRFLVGLNVGFATLLALLRHGDALAPGEWLDQIALLTHWRALLAAALLLFVAAQSPTAAAALLLVGALSAVRAAAIAFVALTLADVLLLYRFVPEQHFLTLVAANWALLGLGFLNWF